MHHKDKNASHKPSLNLSPSRVPERKSSRRRLIHRSSRTTQTSCENSAPSHAQVPRFYPSTHNRSNSPVRLVAERLDHVSPDKLRTHTRTFIRSVKPVEILDAPYLFHTRVSLHTQTSAPLLVGGSTVEGEVSVVFDGGIPTPRIVKEAPISIGRLSVDLLGVEIAQGRKNVFRSLATELINGEFPPPSTMRVAPQCTSELFWMVAPSTSVIPFRLDLPITVGPSPYSLKSASIKYILSTTLATVINEQHLDVRTSQEIFVLSIHDRELQVYTKRIIYYIGYF